MKTFQQIQEGVYDPNIFNAIFLAGGPGSGKSYVVRKTTGGLGMKIVNSDDIYGSLSCSILTPNIDSEETKFCINNIVFASNLATDFRYKFKRDVIIDMVCFRRRGHNETDDPSQTQPVMYQAVANHPGIKNIYQM